MNEEPVVLAGRMIVGSAPGPDGLVRWLLAFIALALAWQTLRPQIAPVGAEASRETRTTSGARR